MNEKVLKELMKDKRIVAVIVRNDDGELTLYDQAKMARLRERTSTAFKVTATKRERLHQR